MAADRQPQQYVVATNYTSGWAITRGNQLVAKGDGCSQDLAAIEGLVSWANSAIRASQAQVPHG